MRQVAAQIERLQGNMHRWTENAHFLVGNAGEQMRFLLAQLRAQGARPAM